MGKNLIENEAAYISAQRRGIIKDRLGKAEKLLSPCRLCPRRCGADRTGGERGVCQGGAVAKVASANPHFGEEPPLVGYKGSGTIFFSHCNLRCIFCQNYTISHMAEGRHCSAEELAGLMIDLQSLGCHNINLVTPTHYLPQILRALDPAIQKGLAVPLVYNCGGYESLEAVRLLDGLIDIYMPDFKYADPNLAARLSKAPDYPDRALEIVLEMNRQVGPLSANRHGIAERGLLIRHLVLPGQVENSLTVIDLLADNLPGKIAINIMDQYYPAYRASEFPGLDRRISREEYLTVKEHARRKLAFTLVK